MSNKLKIVIVSVVIICIGGVLYLSSGSKEKARLYAQYLPADTLLTISLTNVNRMVDEFESSPLGNLLGRESMAKIITELDLGQEALNSYSEACDTLAGVVHNPAFRSVFGDDTTIALIKPDYKKLEANTQLEIERTMVAFATTAATGALDLLAKLLASDTVTKEVVGGITVTKVQVDAGKEIYGFAEKGILLLSYNPETIVKCVGVRQEGNSLAETVLFQNAQKKWSIDEGSIVYSKTFANIQVVKELLEASDNEQTIEYAGMLTGISYLTSLTNEKENELYFDSDISFTYDQLHPMVKGAVDAQAERNDSLHLIGEKCLAYEWASTLSPEFMHYSMIGSDTKELDELLTREIGVSFEDLFTIVGPQYGFVINDIVNSGFLPVPKLIAFTEIRDFAAAEKLFEALREKINESGLAGEKQLKAGDYTVYYWSVLPGEATEVAMVLTPTMFYAANGKSVLSDIIQNGSNTNLSENAAVKFGVQLQKELTEAKLGAAVIYPARLAREVQGIAEWIFTTVAATQGVSVSTLGRGLLDVMGSYDIVVVTSTLTKDGGRWQTTLREKVKVEK